MAAEEDKKFDAVLGGFLVGGLRVPAGNLHCPESDVLAAYHERSLLPEEMHSWKEHIVGCARCQDVLAELERTDSLPVRASAEASEKEEGSKSPEPAAVAREQREPAKFPKKSRILPFARGVRWQWLAPAGALAAGLLVWVAWHENQPSPWKTPAEVRTAKAEPSSTAAPQPPSARQSAASRPFDQTQTDQSLDQVQMDQVAGLSKDQAAVDGAISAKETRMPRPLKQQEKSEARLKSAPAKPPANKEVGRPEGAANGLVARSSRENPPAGEERPGVVAPMTQTVVVQTETADAQMQIQPSPPSAEKSAAPSPLPEAEAGKKSKSEESAHALRRAVAAPPAPNAPAALSDNRSPSRALMTSASRLNLIVTPDRKTLWRAGPAGMIEISSDGGASWSRQTSHVVVDLTAGSAPSEKVCWIVGRAGTILLTTDAGSHWARLPSPLEEEDLGGVRASDALHSTIWNLANTKVFETADGGVSWKPATSQ